MRDDGERAMEIHRADAGARRTALVGLAIALVLGGAALWWLQGWLARLPSGDPDVLDVLLWTAGGVALVTCAVSMAAAALLWRIARLSRAEGRFPPASLRTVRDVPIRQGDAAATAARACQAGAIAIGLLGVACLAWMLWISFALR